jgi:uncharacterized protein YecT (DUF1311 family)
MRIAVTLLATLPALAAAAHAQDGDKGCDQQSTPEIVDCLNGKTAAWDKRLNAAYQKALSDAVSTKQREQLRAAQRLWVQYRDANCLYYDLGEGTIARIDAAECMRSMTETRAKELEGGDQR